MKCQRCGYEQAQGFGFCPVCGMQAPEQSPFEKKVVSILGSGAFLALCILMTVNAAATLFSGGIPVLNVLYTIFFWIVYSKAREGVADVGGMRGVSGTYFAAYVLGYVLAGLLLLLSFLFAIILTFAGKSFEFLQAYMNALDINLNGLPIAVSANTAIAIGWGVAAVFMFLGALMLIYNIFVVRKMHGFVKSTYTCVQTGGATPIVNANLTRIWLWVEAVIAVINTLSSFAEFSLWAVLANGTLAAAVIIGAVLVDKNFKPQIPVAADYNQTYTVE